MSTISNKTPEFFEPNNLDNVVKKYKRRKYYPYKLYIPENLNLEEILDSSPPVFKYYKDCFLYILHLIVSIPLRLKDFDLEKQKGFTPIDKKLLSRRIHAYNDYIDYLKKYNIIEEGTSYKPGYYSKGLKFMVQYRTKVKGVYITKNTLIKSITEKNYHRDIEAEHKLWFLKKWFNANLTIDMEKTVEFLELDKEISRKKLERKRASRRIKKTWIPIDEIVTMGYNMKYIVADKINEGKNHHPIVDSTSGRFHSPLTQLKKELRMFVRYNGENLHGIDIVNSQPLLALVILDYDLFIKNEIYKIIAQYNPILTELNDVIKTSNFKNPISTMLVNLIKRSKDNTDVKLFKRAVVEGKFYEYFAELLKQNSLVPQDIMDKPQEIRKFAKNATFTALFSKPEDVMWNAQIKAFRKCFPTVYRIFSLIKSGKNNHPTLACLLQRFESNLILHTVCAGLNKLIPKAPIFTVHDSIVTTEKYLSIVTGIFRGHLAEKLGVNPQLKIEEW